jgi:hypothetical protein
MITGNSKRRAHDGCEKYAAGRYIWVGDERGGALQCLCECAHRDACRFANLVILILGGALQRLEK